MPMISGRAVSDQEMVDEIRIRMRCKGYRPVTEADLVPGAELVMVDVERFYLSGAELPPIGMAGTMVIKLDEKPVDGVNANNEKIVWFNCINPQWDGQCFVPLLDFVHDAYVLHGCHFNDTRYFAKA